MILAITLAASRSRPPSSLSSSAQSVPIGQPWLTTASRMSLQLWTSAFSLACGVIQLTHSGGPFMPTQSALRELPPAPSFLSTRQGKLTLAFLCMVGFLDFVDASIVNVALPSIRRDLHFSVQSLQWVLSAYLLTYGGFMLLGGRAADLLGRRRLLVAGTSVFGISSLVGGIATTELMLVGARLAQGMGAAMMIPAALSILTTTFTRATDRSTALGAWGAMAGIGSAAGAFLGGVLSQGPGWRWVFFVNLPVCVAVLAATFRLVGAERRRPTLRNFDLAGAVLATAGELLLVYALVGG